MSKIKSVGSNKILYNFVLRSVISSVISLLLGIVISSVIIYKLDVSLDFSKIFGVIIVLFASMIVAYISVGGIKNNGALMGMISEIPILLYVLINLIFSNTSIVIFFIKIIICLLCGFIIGLTKTKQNRKFKVK